MKYVYQIGIITGICFVSEVLYQLIPLPVPSNIYGLAILFTLLMTGIVKIEQIQEISDWLLAVMPILFISPSVKLMTSFDVIQGSVGRLLCVAFVSTIVTMVVTGYVTQWMIRWQKRRGEAVSAGEEERTFSNHRMDGEVSAEEEYGGAVLEKEAENGLK